MKSEKRQCPQWVVVAAHEFMKMVRHLNLKSINNASKELHLNYRTLRKLDMRRPDPSLTLEMVMKVWHSLDVFATVIQSPDRADEEHRLVAESMMRIVGSFPLSAGLRQAVCDAAEDTDGEKCPSR